MSNYPDNKVEGLLGSLNRLRQVFNRREKIGFLVLLVAMIGGAVLETLSIGAIPLFVSLALDPEKVFAHQRITPVLEWIGIETSRGLILGGGTILIVIFLMKTIYMFVLTYFKIRYTQNRQLNLADRLFTAYMHAPYTFHLQRNTSELLRNIQIEVGRIIFGVLSSVLGLMLQALMTLALLSLLFASEPLMAFLSLLFFGMAGGGYEIALKRRLRTFGISAQKHSTLMVQAIQQGVGVLKEVRVLRRELYFTRKMRVSLQRIMRADRFSNLAGQMTGPYMEFLALAGLLGVGMGLIALGRDLQSIAPTLVLFAAVFVRLKGSVVGIVSSFTALRFNVVAVHPVYTDLKTLNRLSQATPPPDDTQGQKWKLRREINLVDIGYRYPGSHADVLSNIDMKIECGSSIAFVGPTGSGKTTLVDLILGLLEPTHGIIKVDGNSIHDDLAGWQRTIGYIPQFIYLTDDTIRRNIALGVNDDEIDDNQIAQVIRAARLDDFVQGLPQHADTIVGERGVRLSGGQRQRVGIARALYHDPDILVMDEATSALDTATERSVVAAVNRLKGERTVIMIAHRLSTVRECDRLYFLQNGVITASGRYDELIETNEAFRVMAGTDQ